MEALIGFTLLLIIFGMAFYCIHKQSIFDTVISFNENRRKEHDVGYFAEARMIDNIVLFKEKNFLNAEERLIFIMDNPKLKNDVTSPPLSRKWLRANLLDVTNQRGWWNDRIKEEYRRIRQIEFERENRANELAHQSQLVYNERLQKARRLDGNRRDTDENQVLS